MRISLLTVFMVFLIQANCFLEAQIIPDNHKIDWSPGIPGGIPVVDSPVNNILDYGADPTGNADSYDAIIQAVDGLPSSGGVVLIPSGKYRINSTVRIRKSNVILRGEGIHSTRLYSYASGNCFEIVEYKRGDWQKLVSGFEHYSKTVSVENGSLFAVGEFIEIQQENDPALMYTQPEWDQGWSKNSVGQVAEIESINGNILNLKTALHYSFDSQLNPVIRPQKFVRGVGMEDFYIEKMVAAGNNFYIENSAYCWLKDIESYHTRIAHVYVSVSVGLEIRNCFMHRSFSYGGGGSGYGIDCSLHSSDGLFENNVFDSLRHAMLVQVGTNGNVFGYNLSLNPLQGEGEENLNQGWLPPDISIHGHYPFMNLFEGNDVYEIGIGDYWGPAGPGNTYFRNRVHGEGIFYYDHSNFQNLLGNVASAIEYTDGTSEFMIEHGNIVNGVVQWNDTIHDHNLQASYYLSTKPDFLNDYNWPVYGPETESGNLLPASDWYENWKLNGSGNSSIYGLGQGMQLSVFPNPALKTLNISYSGIKEGESILQIYNSTGALLEAINPLDTSGFIQWNPVEELSGGLYYVILRSGRGKFLNRAFIILN